MAKQAGKPVEQCLTDAAIALLDERNVFLAAVQESIDAAGRGQFVEDDDVLKWLHDRERG